MNARMHVVITRTILALFLFLFCLIPLYGNENYKVEAEGILKQYSPQGYDIIKKVDSLETSYTYQDGSGITIPQMPFTIVLDTMKKLSMMMQGEQPTAFYLPVTVHEQCHFYNNYYIAKSLKDQGMGLGDKKYYFYYDGSNKSSLITVTETFPSKEIFPSIPKILYERIFDVKKRVDTYINGSPNHVTQKYGIYGLMDEYTAYAMSIQLLLDMIPYYKKNVHQKQQWIDFGNLFGTHMISYFSFKMFIIQYLKHARIEYSAIYEEIINNKPFITSLKRVDDKFNKLQLQLGRTQRDLERLFKKKRWKADFGDMYLDYDMKVMKGELAKTFYKQEWNRAVK
jgi:hypothetical protein